MREWFRGLSETGKVTLVAAVITTVGGGVFGIATASIALLGDGEADKADGPGKTGQGGARPGRGAPDDKPGSSTSGPKCVDSLGPWKWQQVGEIRSTDGLVPRRDEIHFANTLVKNGSKDARDDFLVVNRRTGAVRAWRNDGLQDEKLAWGLEAGMTRGATLDPEKEKVEFADLDGDGLDDYLVVDQVDGAVRAWRNTGESRFGGGGDPGRPDWRNGARVPESSRDRVRIEFADIDGNGRDDYLLMDTDSGAVWAWWNQGKGNGRPNWREAGSIHHAWEGGKDSPAFHNVNCDKKADYLVSTEKGPVGALLNRSATEGGKTRWGKRFELSFGNSPEYTKKERDFADLNGDGRADIVWVDLNDGRATPHLSQGGEGT